MSTRDERSPAEITIADFAALPPFRAASEAELINVDNPFRRPVRPDDLGFLRYDTPIAPAEASSLRALIGHRILLNSYETAAHYLRPLHGLGAHDEARIFESDDALLHATACRPHLEKVLLHSLVSSGAQPRDGSAAEARLADTLKNLADPQYAYTYLLLQESCSRTVWKALYAGLVHADDTQLTPHLWHTAEAGLKAAIAREQWAAALSEKWNLATTPRAYWQFYLPSTLAITTHLWSLVQPAADLTSALVALSAHARHQQRRDHTLERLSCALDVDVPNPPAQDIDTVEPLLGDIRSYDEAGKTQSNVADTLWIAADNELDAQLRWADNLNFYIDAGEQIQSRIDADHLDIDLDTFIESDDETSTTHVHDDHRLVVIESGEMDFWNNAGRTIHMATGDKLLIPRARLHGSVVRSGLCTYHQPIIPDEMMRVAGIPATQITPAGYSI